MVDNKNDREFSDLIEKFRIELGVVVEREPRQRRSAFIFTVEECKQPMVLKLMDELGIREYQTFDVKFRKAQQPTSRRGNNLVKIDDPEIVAQKYISYEDGIAYIQFMAQKINESNPKVSAVIADEGQTYEKRKIKSITISHSEKLDNPVIFIDAGIHAREWHARSMALYLLKKLADEPALDKSGILYQASFVIVPRF